MRKIRNVLVAFVVVVLLFCCPFVFSQANSLPVVWQKQFPDSIDWYVSTSSDVLLVRAGKTLFAVAGKDGQELWSMKSLQTGMGGMNLLEIPGTPVLLAIHDEPGGTRQEPSDMLIAVDMRSGKVVCQLQGITNLYELIPFYEREHMLLVTGPDPNLGYFKPQLHFLNILKGDSVKSQQFAKTSLGILPSCPVEWQEKYSRNYMEPALGRVLTFKIFDDQLYTQSGSKEVARVDLQTGKPAWTFETGKPAWAFGGGGKLAFEDGKVLVAGKDVSALDPASGKPLWTAKDFDATVLIAEQGVVFGVGKKGAFALDLATGSVRWQVESNGPASDLELFKEGRLLVFGEKLGLVVVAPDSGKVLRRISADRPRIPRLGLLPSLTSLVKLGLIFAGVGHHFLLVLTAKGLTLYDLTTGNELWTEAAKGSYALSFFLSNRGPRPPSSLSGATFLWKKMEKNEWKLWRIDPSTGQREEWTLNGEQPEVSVDLVYTFTHDTLRAFKLTGQ